MANMIREYVEADLEQAAKVWLRSGQGEYHYLPAFQSLNESQAVNVFRQVIQSSCRIWICESEAEVAGFIAMDNDLIDRLNVDPSFQRMGIGSELIKFAKRLYPNGIMLKTHRQNTRARTFYEKHGFYAAAYGISPAPESVPDVEYRWPGQPIK